LTDTRGHPAIDMNAVISNLLKYGVVASTILVAGGVALLILETPQSFPGSVQQLVSTNYDKPTLDVSTLFGGVVAANPVYLIELGLIVLLATPVARVAASVVMFAAEKDKLYVAVTLFVLIVLLFGLFVVGPIEAAAG
jgi:uncharacterized membrane protein